MHEPKNFGIFHSSRRKGVKISAWITPANLCRIFLLVSVLTRKKLCEFIFTPRMQFLCIEWFRRSSKCDSLTVFASPIDWVLSHAAIIFAHSLKHFVLFFFIKSSGLRLYKNNVRFSFTWIVVTTSTNYFAR